MKKRALFVLVFGLTSTVLAFPSMVSEEEDWLHSDVKRCVMSDQSRLDQSLVIEAEKGNQKAQLQLATYLLTGTKVPYSPKQAYLWLEKAASQGSSKAFYLLGALTESGEAVPKDFSQASKYYQKAFDLGEEAAFFDMIRLHRQYPDQFQADLSQADAQLIDLAKQGNARAELLYGLDLMKDQSSDARLWFNKAASHGELQAFYYLGLAFLHDEDTSLLDDRALAWIRDQADANQGHCAYLLGLLYHFGYGVEQNAQQASHYLELARPQGYDFDSSDA